MLTEHLFILYFIYQAVARGYLVRKRNKNDNIETVRERLQIATENAREEMTLGRRTRSALDFLLLCKDLSRILDSLIHLGKESSLARNFELIHQLIKKIKF